ncbi:cop9 signalosome complex subunit 7b [Stylonychia lemnae]|uniref:Cop9 signalosome complex subunit 7b n=1 Tax=Stylonychia lemnae TaxID=5949 RepID=A0A077ZR07_STYLE|nr:cop9 signalosome complex subunit 7b [Stylonychia lemnae]|eukprot:CDW71884.1 cop9 signalosome complex subunit 7b [Stylonychia lemnae]
MPSQESTTQIEQFLILAKGQKSKALETIIDQILSHGLIYVFGEFLSQPNFMDIGADNKFFRTLELFAYDNYLVYKNSKDAFIDLKPQQVKKLKMISIADRATRDKILNYSQLMNDLDIQNLRELEDLIIDCIYNELLTGKLDQLNKQFHVVDTYGRDVREADVSDMIKKLEDWDDQLEKSQVFIEKNMRDCNSSIMISYEQQLIHEQEIRDKRDQLLRDIMAGKEQEYGGSGPLLTLGKKSSSKKDDRGKGIGGFFFKIINIEMKKAKYQPHQPKNQLSNDPQSHQQNSNQYEQRDKYDQHQHKNSNHKFDSQQQKQQNDYRLHSRDNRLSNTTKDDDHQEGDDEEEEELDMDIVNNEDLEQKINQMREKIRRQQLEQEGSEGENDYDQEDQEQQEDYGQEDNDNLEHEEEQYQSQVYNNQNHQYEEGDEEDLRNQVYDQESFSLQQRDPNESDDEGNEIVINQKTENNSKKFKNQDINAKIEKMKLKIEQFKNKSQTHLKQRDKDHQSESFAQEIEDSSVIHKQKVKIKNNHRKDKSRHLQNQDQSDDDQQSQSNRKIKQKKNNEIVSKRIRQNQSDEEEENDRKNSRDYDSSSNESFDHDNDDNFNDTSQITDDDGVSRYTAKSKKSRRGKRKNADKSPDNTTNIFDPNIFPLGMMTPGGMIPDPATWTAANPLGMNQMFTPGIQPNIMNPLLGQNPQMMPIPPPGLNPLELAAFYQQQQMLQQQQAQQTFGPNILPNFMMQQQSPHLMNQQNMMFNPQLQIQHQQRQLQENQQLQAQLQQQNSDIQVLNQKLFDKDKELQQLQMLLQDQKIQYEQEIKMISRESNYKYDDFNRLMNENQFLVDKYEKVQVKFQALKSELEQQKEFYEKALEQRFNQMEEFEEECMRLRQTVEELENNQNDNRIKCEMAVKDKETLKKQLQIKDKETFEVSRKEEDLLAKLDELQQQLKEKDIITEKKVEESFNLKSKIDQQRQELDKMRKRMENIEDQLTHKELQFKQVNEDFIEYKKKQRYDQGKIQGGSDDIKGELMVERQQNNNLRAQIDHLQEELYDAREQLQEVEQLRRERDQLKRELQQPNNKNQRQSANNENIYNSGGLNSNRNQKQQIQRDRDDFEENNAVQWNGPPSKKEAPNRQARPQQNNFIEEQPKTQNRYNLPESFFRDNDFTEDQILDSALSKRPLVNDRSNNISARQQLVNPRNQGYVPPGIQTKQDKEREQKMEQVKNIEQNLLSLQLDQKKLQGEFDRIPESAKTIAQRRRKEELDREIKIVNKNISNLKNKLRELDALHR